LDFPVCLAASPRVSPKAVPSCVAYRFILPLYNRLWVLLLLYDITDVPGLYL
jgi:hypothetical protein